MADRPRDNDPPDQPPEPERPERRPDKPERPGSSDRPYEMSKEYQPDRKKLTPIQRDFARQMADAPPEFAGDVPYKIDWKTGEPIETRPPRLESDEPEFGDVSGVHDPIDPTRPYDKPGGLTHADQRDQWSLEHTLPRDEDGNFEKFPDPDGEWTEYVNDGGPDTDRFRGNNCLDCSMAAIATFHGEPTVAAPRTPDREPDGGINDWSGERRGPTRAATWLEGRYETLGSGDAGFAVVEQKLREGGHGSSAAIINSWTKEAGGGAHAWNAFNHEGKITWYDPQCSITSDRPIYGAPLVRSVSAICIDPEGKQL